MRSIILIAHNVRSTHNIGSLMRTAEGLGVEKLYLTGYTPYPESAGDTRLPHIARKLTLQIRKTALGAEEQLPWEHRTDIDSVIQELKSREYEIVALEQTKDAIALPDYRPGERVAIIIGREVEGIEDEVLALCDKT